MSVLRGAWRLARWLVILEIGIWRSLLLWVTSRRGRADSGKGVVVAGTTVDIPVMKLTRIGIALRGPTAIALPDAAQGHAPALLRRRPGAVRGRGPRAALGG